MKDTTKLKMGVIKFEASEKLQFETGEGLSPIFNVNIQFNSEKRAKVVVTDNSHKRNRVFIWLTRRTLVPTLEFSSSDYVGRSINGGEFLNADIGNIFDSIMCDTEAAIAEHLEIVKLKNK